MGLEWNPVGLPAMLALVVGWATGLFVYFAAPRRLQNRLLALVLIFEGTCWGTGGGLLYQVDDEGLAYGIQSLFYVCLLVLPGLYLLFLSTLDSPLVAPFRGLWVRGILAAATAAAPLLYFLDRPGWTLEMVPTWYASWEGVLGPNFGAWFPVYGLVCLFGLAVTVTALLRAKKGTLARQQMMWFTAAFGVRDAVTVLIVLVAPFFFPLPPSGSISDLVYVWGAPAGTLVFIPIMTYGILKHHLFDIDVRIRWTIRQGTLASIFLVVIVVVGQIAQNFFGEALGWWVGGLAAAALLLGLQPLQRFAERVAARTMPQATGTPEYLTFKKLEVYQAALEGAWRDGRITERETGTLERLRLKLGIQPADARRLEADVRGVLGTD